jgi:hypothetical protein
MSEASAVAAGFGCSTKDDMAPAHWNVPVTEPHNIEVPRSLAEVVISWNIPMHKWLKQCKLNKKHLLYDLRFQVHAAVKRIWKSANEQIISTFKPDFTF